MSDEALRKIETLLAQSPSDSGTRVRWIMEKNKMGEALVDTYYKISNGEKYYSKTSYLHPWTKNGTKFKTRHEAVKALDSDLSAKDNWRQKKTISLKNTSLDKIKLVEISTYVVERELEVDFIEERTKSELESIRLKRNALDKQEERVKLKASNERKALLQKEQKLLKKIKKSK